MPHRKVVKLDDFRWILPKEGEMRVEGIVYANETVFNQIREEKALEQVRNVATLQGIVGRSMAMPDAHWGYGFPIGGVAAMDAEEGVVSPGGVGYDINCGCRLVKTNMERSDLPADLSALAAKLFNDIPSGVGSTGSLTLSRYKLKGVLREGARWAVKEGFGYGSDIDNTEDGGCLPVEDPSLPSERAFKRGSGQVGTLGSGNHFLEIQYVEKIFDREKAEVFGLFEGQTVVMLHSGSRGFGYQVCDDFLKVMAHEAVKEKLLLPDRQLACAPIRSHAAKSYLDAMNSAANYAWANRQVMTHLLRETFESYFGESHESLGMTLLYDVCHNIAKFETHEVEGEKRNLLVHRKGATRGFGPGRRELGERYRKTGQPILIPGDMGTASWVLAGTQKAMEETFGSCCHGAGRVLSRKAALKLKSGSEVARELEKRGIVVFSAGKKTLAEEMPEAYKDVDEVVESVSGAGLGEKVARLRPLGVIKG